jgi:hypothetical protein
LRLSSSFCCSERSRLPFCVGVDPFDAGGFVAATVPLTARDLAVDTLTFAAFAGDLMGNGDTAIWNLFLYKAGFSWGESDQEGEDVGMAQTRMIKRKLVV